MRILNLYLFVSAQKASTLQTTRPSIKLCLNFLCYIWSTSSNLVSEALHTKMLHEMNYNLLLTRSHNNEEQTFGIFALIVGQYVILQWLSFFVYKRQYPQILHKDGIPDPTSELLDYPVATNSSQQVFVKSQIHSLRQNFFSF